MKLRDLMNVTIESTLIHVVCRAKEGFSFKVKQYNTKNCYTFDREYGNYEVMAIDPCREGEICVVIRYAE